MLGVAFASIFCLAGPASLAAEKGESSPPPETAAAKSGSGSEGDQEKKPAAPGEKSTPEASVTPKPGGAAKMTPSVKTTPPARTAPAPKPTPAPALRFTDDDLLKYREPLPGDDDEEDGEGTSEEVPGVNPAMPGAAGKPGSAPAPAAAGAVPQPSGDASKPAWAAPPLPPPPKPPPSTAVMPAADPLREHHAREADKARRAAQIDGIRGELASIEGRLSYLQQKRQAILDPLNIMPAGRSDEERQANAGLKPKELLDQVDQQIKELDKQREAVQERLAAIETRFGGGE